MCRFSIPLGLGLVGLDISTQSCAELRFLAKLVIRGKLLELYFFHFSLLPIVGLNGGSVQFLILQF